jgi:hypothetical protein
LLSSLINPSSHASPAIPTTRQIQRPIPALTAPKPPPTELILAKKMIAPSAMAANEARAIFFRFSSNSFVLSPMKHATTTPITPRRDNKPQLLNPFAELPPNPPRLTVIHGSSSETSATPAAIKEYSFCLWKFICSIQQLVLMKTYS